MTPEFIRISSADYPTALTFLAITNRANEVDLPGWPPFPEIAFRASLDLPWPGNAEEKYLVLLDGEPAGVVDFTIPLLDNVTNFFSTVRTDPAMRGRGVGAAMVQFSIDRARELGRARVALNSAIPIPGSDGPEDPAVAALAARFGFKAVLPEVHRALDVATIDEEALDRMLADAWTKADGYELVQWSGDVPERFVEDVAYLDGRLIEDAPMGDLVIEAMKIDAQRVRDTEAAIKARGRRPHDSGMVHTESGRLVCWTSIVAEEGLDWHAWQQITIVEPQHRGHRLGTIVKIANLRYFMKAEPKVTEIGTFNAAANSYMIAINEDMGFRARHAFENWQLEL
ncbi:GNAT superfamily N-acetyltransferase [Allocatelliglobosispora scoriae]|uniref:GNAT superfamily N-acetyltransferase n=1 Tax=Allocatelliglobosispora scoriae TaxID=643052 RepID=A0A841BTB5_9ACTN|nr:GNAT family N-acetyltransferase [Allocatelliglobosispora scoriae]MBB5870668.1 GNAT superfamily N-acetyltransferase [Allocatelliglobosispora scoriae]